MFQFHKAKEDNEKDEDMPIPIPNKKRKKQETLGVTLSGEEDHQAQQISCEPLY